MDNRQALQPMAKDQNLAQQAVSLQAIDELQQGLTLAQHTVYKKYISELQHYPLCIPSQQAMRLTPEECVRMLHLSEFSCKKGEDPFQKLSTVYHASMALGCSLFVMVDAARRDQPIRIYLGVKDDSENRLNTSFKTLEQGLRSNFPGTRLEEIAPKNERSRLLDEVFGNHINAISSVSCVAAIRDKSKTEHKSFVQGIEKFIDAMSGNTYTALFLAKPIPPEVQHQNRTGYEQLYTTLSSYQKTVLSYSASQSRAVTESLTSGFSESVSEGTTQSQTRTKNLGISVGLNGERSSGVTETQSVSQTQLRAVKKGKEAAQTASDAVKSAPEAIEKAAQAFSEMGTGKKLLLGAAVVGGIALTATVLPIIAPAAGTAITTVGNVALKAAPTVAKSLSLAGSETKGTSIANSIQKSLGLSGGLSAGLADSKMQGTQNSTTTTDSDSTTHGSTDTDTSGQTRQIETVNKPIVEMLQRIDDQLKRLKEGEDYGSYSCCAYFLASRQQDTLLAANTYRALMLGEGTSVEHGAINTWVKSSNTLQGRKGRPPETIDVLKEYLRCFEHPVFIASMTGDLNNPYDYVTYTPGTSVSGLELPLHLGLPCRSVNGLPVINHAEFGRNVYDRSGAESQLRLGSIYHMGSTQDKSAVKLNLQELASHTFVTGATGSGKSNTIYQILSRLRKQDIRFLVVEPAKGEYKEVLGRFPDVTVYGTNPVLNDCRMLSINPFSFPKEIHVLEHLDRLVELFNVCWPMYAAMPVILKDAMERAYQAAGWDLLTSENRYSDKLFPSFSDVLEAIRNVLNESDYSADNKGDYTGSLVTRIRSLTNGINGLIFSSGAISDEELFDQNAIIDLSRIGSAETKSLLMGLLVLKLQEHRMCSGSMNAPLSHVTVLEEAHNLLRRTSADQPTESSNLLGKSVEMLANSIAEMRTYGEGFIIADQSPGLLDLSVIRNTNTKIIMRLPDYSDRELVGKAAGLREDQVVELGMLERGVAAIVQSSWLEPVLCMVDPYSYTANVAKREKKTKTAAQKDVERSVLEWLMSISPNHPEGEADIDALSDDLISSTLPTRVKINFMDFIYADESAAPKKLRRLVYDFFSPGDRLHSIHEDQTMEQWTAALIADLNPQLDGYREEQIYAILALIVLEQAERDVKYQTLCLRYTKWMAERGIIPCQS